MLSYHFSIVKVLTWYPAMGPLSLLSFLSLEQPKKGIALATAFCRAVLLQFHFVLQIAKEGNCPSCSRKSALRAGFASDAQRFASSYRKASIPTDSYSTKKAQLFSWTFLVEPKKGIEPLTCSLRVSCSTPEPLWRAT